MGRTHIYICRACEQDCNEIWETVPVIHHGYCITFRHSLIHKYYIMDLQNTIHVSRQCKYNYNRAQKWPVFGISHAYNRTTLILNIWLRHLIVLRTSFRYHGWYKWRTHYCHAHSISLVEKMVGNIYWLLLEFARARFPGILSPEGKYFVFIDFFL
jgi:hypothetical protein